MKKLLLILGCVLGLGAPAITATVIYSQPAIVVVAEGEEQTEVQSSEQDPAPAIVEESVDAWSKFVAEYLSADKGAMYMSWLAYIGTIIGLVANFNKLKRANNLTLKNVSDDVRKTLQEVIGKEVMTQTERFLPAVIKAQEKTNDILKIFSKILALGQENTPEARVAILQLIEELGTVGKEITDAAKEAVEEEVKAIEEHKEEVNEKLDEIIDNYDGTSI